MTDATTVLEVKQRMSGDQPVMDGAYDTTIEDAIGQVTDLLNEEIRNLRGEPEGWTFVVGTPVVSRYTGRGNSPLLPINDSTAVSAVAILDPTGNVIKTLVAGTDYLPYPLNSLPITGLTAITCSWPTYTGAVQVSRTPGYAAAWPPNLALAAVEEVIRAIRAGQAGVDDRLGMTPYGTVVVSKALLQSTQRAIARYRYGGGVFRG